MCRRHCLFARHFRLMLRARPPDQIFQPLFARISPKHGLGSSRQCNDLEWLRTCISTRYWLSNDNGSIVAPKSLSPNRFRQYCIQHTIKQRLDYLRSSCYLNWPINNYSIMIGVGVTDSHVIRSTIPYHYRVTTLLLNFWYKAMWCISISKRQRAITLLNCQESSSSTFEFIPKL